VYSFLDVLVNTFLFTDILYIAIERERLC